MNACLRSLAYLALATHFASCLLLSRSIDAPPLIQAGGAFGLGASIVEVVWWWHQAERLERNPTARHLGRTPRG